MAMYIIDSTILIAEILSKYPQNEENKKILGFYRKIPLMKRVVTDYILTEFESYMLHILPTNISLGLTEKKQLHDIFLAYLRQIQNNYTIITINPQIVKNAFSLYQQYKNGSDSNYISFADCLLLASAIQLQYTIISMDMTLLGYAKELRIPHYETLPEGI